MLHFRAMLGHLGAKMANKMGKMTAKSAKMGQLGPKKALTDARRQRRPARKADVAGPLEELFRKEKTKESGRICKRHGKGFDEVV